MLRVIAPTETRGSKFKMPPPSVVPGYALIKKVAEGGFSEIYEGQELITKEIVAIKILHPRHHGNKAEYKRILVEGALGLRLRHHPHIVRILKVGKAGRAPYMVMEFIAGLNLRELLRRNEKFSERRILEIAGAVAKALRFMHESNVYHKDIKPENIMTDGKGTIKVIDMGLAETQMGVTFGFFGRSLEGSPAYMAPELIRTKKPSRGSDLYALGCTLYEIATGKLVFSGVSDQDVMTKQLNMTLQPEPISESRPDLSVFTQKLIMNALVKDIHKRYQSADEFLLELSRNPLAGNRPSHSAIPAGWLKKR